MKRPSMFAAILLAILFALPLTALPAFSAQSPAPPVVTHELTARFDPKARRLDVTDTLTLPADFSGPLRLELSPRVRDFAAMVEGRALPARFIGGVLVLEISGKKAHPDADSGAGTGAGVGAAPGAVILSYSLPLAAPPERAPIGNDNPGALAEDATAGDDWAMLMPGAAWHAVVLHAANAYTLSVTAPKGLKAVTQGALLGFDDGPDATVSRWSVPHPEGRLGLCLAPYQVERENQAPAPVYTFLLPGSARLAPVYLAASARHLAFYQNLHGPYPFEKFAVVENPLPTGYGLPSYTLLGSQVLALPFIPDTSLRHEIAHSWWGCGVLVNYASGNWCEGLTTYVADYLAQEARSSEDARAYRVQALRSFAELTAGGRDFPLDRFVSRTSPASQAVGYSKALLVFHMLRRQVGDQAFFDGLRRLYAARLFRLTAWKDILDVYAGLPGFSPAQARVFLNQWLTRTGGPRLALGPARVTQTAHGYQVRGQILQHGQPYALRLTLRADTPLGPVERTLEVTRASTPFSLDCQAKPTRLTLDPEADVFRLLDPSEIPPSVNSVKASRNLAVIATQNTPPALLAALPTLLEGLNHPHVAITREADLTPKALRALEKSDILFVGTPTGPQLAALVPPAATPRAPDYSAAVSTGTPGVSQAAQQTAASRATPSEAQPASPAARPSSAEQTAASAQDVAPTPATSQPDTTFTVLDRPVQGHARRFTALFTAAAQAEPAHVARAAAKITHYGKYSRLGFSQARNIDKALAEPAASPMVREL